MPVNSQHGCSQREPHRIRPCKHQFASCITLNKPLYIQVHIDDGFLNLMTAEGAEKNDVKVPEGDLGKQIEAEYEEGKELIISVVSSMGEEAALGVKV